MDPFLCAGGLFFAVDAGVGLNSGSDRSHDAMLDLLMEGEMQHGSAVYVLRDLVRVDAVVGGPELAVGVVDRPVHVVLGGGASCSSV